jgi:hypothetical protein
MSHHDPDRITPWTRSQLWAEDDERNQRTQGRVLTFTLIAAWFASTVAAYPWTTSTAVHHRSVMPPLMQCHVGDHCVLAERLRLQPAAAPVVLCVTRSAR